MRCSRSVGGAAGIAVAASRQGRLADIDIAIVQPVITHLRAQARYFHPHRPDGVKQTVVKDFDLIHVMLRQVAHILPPLYWECMLKRGRMDRAAADITILRLGWRALQLGGRSPLREKLDMA